MKHAAKSTIATLLCIVIWMTVKTQTYQPAFTFHGFQYVEITTDAPITIH